MKLTPSRAAFTSGLIIISLSSSDDCSASLPDSSVMSFAKHVTLPALKRDSKLKQLNVGSKRVMVASTFSSLNFEHLSTSQTVILHANPLSIQECNDCIHVQLNLSPVANTQSLANLDVRKNTKKSKTPTNPHWLALRVH